MDNKQNETEFTLQRDSYVSFDALTLKQFIKQRLNEGGIYTDQNFEGSNISSIIDVIAFSYHTLLFYLNRTSAETMFTDSTIYENMNRIVKLIDYKPKGYQTSLLPFTVKASSSLDKGSYTIQRYSYFNVDGTFFTFRDDTTFIKNTDTDESLFELSDTTLLRQGQYIEYPIQYAIGEDFESIILSLKSPINGDSLKIDHDSIDIYVKDVETNEYNFYTETNNIFLETPQSLKYEKRLNEHGLYEFKFGNDVFGSKLKQGDQVFIYYLLSDGDAGIVSKSQLNNSVLSIFNTPQFTNIKGSIYNDTYTFLENNQTPYLAFSNSIGSSSPKDIESVDEIRTNATKNLQIQNRIVTTEDFKRYIDINYSNIIKSTAVVDVKQYINEYLKYFYDIGLNKPNDDSRVLYNQVRFATTNQTNNVFIFMVPKFLNVDENNAFHYISTAQKTSILNSLERKRLLNTDIMPQDPVYVSFGLGVPIQTSEVLTPDIINQTYLVLKRDVTTNTSADTLKQRVNNIFKKYFSDLEIGCLVSVNEILAEIFKLSGITNIYTRRIVGDKVYETPNISMISFNPIYPENDIRFITGDYQLPFFKYPFLQDSDILDKIIIENA